MIQAPPIVPLSSPQSSQVCAALANAQGKFRPPKRTKPVSYRRKDGTVTKYSYAPLEEIIDAVKDALAENSILRQQYLIRGDDGGYCVRTIIWHASGEWIGGDYPVLYTRDTGAQGFAAGVTYARRYGLSLALGLAPEDDDDAEIADAIVQEMKPQRPQQPVQQAPPNVPVAADVMVDADEVAQLEAEIKLHNDRLLMVAKGQAGLPAMAKLEEAWRNTPVKIARILEGEHKRVYKQMAEAVDTHIRSQQQQPRKSGRMEGR
ncbi:MAG: ERF family protein [Acetobacteraceae bacterium]|nr:ERF family protein [Acetobacteraceae bacterium]